MFSVQAEQRSRQERSASAEANVSLSDRLRGGRAGAAPRGLNPAAI